MCKYFPFTLPKFYRILDKERGKIECAKEMKAWTYASLIKLYVESRKSQGGIFMAEIKYKDPYEHFWEAEIKAK